MKFAIDYMFKISSLGAGVGFGELALINSKPRSATIVTEEDTWCAILLKVPFEAILQKFERDKITAMISILDRFLLFKTYTRITKTYLLKGIQKLEFTRGQVLFDEGDTPDKIFFLVSGEYEMFK